MKESVERNYSDALFGAIIDENESVEQAKEQLDGVQRIISQSDGFVKLMDAPTVTTGEKLAIVKEAFEGKVSRCVYNFLCVVTEGKRWGSFEGICKRFRALCNEHLNIAEITVTSAFPLTDEQRKAVSDKMSKIIGKSIVMTEKVDKSIVGGIVVDYGDTRLDGSVKTKLENLKESFGKVIS